jgi:formiminoglutamase
VKAALDVAGSGASSRPIHVSVDLSVCDRATAPACRDSVPGGLTARELLKIVFTAALDARVRTFDIVGVDANADVDDQRTVRLIATAVLEIAAALMLRG